MLKYSSGELFLWRASKMSDLAEAAVEKPALFSGPADMEGSSDKLFCCRLVRNRIPLAYREELYHILRMAGPLVRMDTAYIPSSFC